MSRRWLAIGPLAALMLVSAAAGSGQMAYAQSEPVLPAAVTPAVDTTSPDQSVPTITLGRVIGVVTGIAFGEVLLHGMIGLPGLPSIVAGGFAGWHVYTNYIEPQVKSGVRTIAAAADEARLYWTAAPDPG
jgi:hypothetical protein